MSKKHKLVGKPFKMCGEQVQLTSKGDLVIPDPDPEYHKLIASASEVKIIVKSSLMHAAAEKEMAKLKKLSGDFEFDNGEEGWGFSVGCTHVSYQEVAEAFSKRKL